MLVKLTYFKKSGKYYSEGVYETKFDQMFEVFDEVRILPFHPGLSGRWGGTILVTCDSDTGYPGLVNVTTTSTRQYKEDDMKRYNIIEHSYGDGDISMEIREDEKGQFVEYEDIKHLLQNTSSNSDYTKRV